jgi:aminoglycoside phosphotransferase (APT) family kinase protein
MPKMPGQCFHERNIMKLLRAEDRHGIAQALAEMLVEMQKLTSPFAGNFDVDTVELAPFPSGNTGHVIDETRDAVATAQANGVMTADDLEWIAAAERSARAVGERPNTYVHCDYKLNNLTVSRDGNGWRVTGLFDLHEARFGDGVLDLVRQTCSYLDTEPPLARVFVDTYFSRVTGDPQIKELLPLYLINDRMKFWTFFANPESPAPWTKGRTFRGWAEPYLDAMLALI